MKIIIYLFFVLIMSCESNIESDYITYDCEELQIFYEESVAPIFNNNCAGCHSATNKSGNLALDNFDVSVDGIMNGQVISRINMDISNPLFMPLGSEKLSQQDIDIVQSFSEQLCR